MILKRLKNLFGASLNPSFACSNISCLCAEKHNRRTFFKYIKVFIGIKIFPRSHSRHTSTESGIKMYVVQREAQQLLLRLCTKANNKLSECENLCGVEESIRQNRNTGTWRRQRSALDSFLVRCFCTSTAPRKEPKLRNDVGVGAEATTERSATVLRLVDCHKFRDYFLMETKKINHRRLYSFISI